MSSFTGRCLCGAIHYKVDGPIGAIIHCHCSMCRRWHGSAYRTRASALKKDFSWTQGESQLGKFNSSEATEKTFCTICGSSLVSFYKKHPDSVGISMGTLDQDPGIRPSCHIFVGSKAPWHEIEDDLPQYEVLPPDTSILWNPRKES